MRPRSLSDALTLVTASIAAASPPRHHEHLHHRQGQSAEGDAGISTIEPRAFNTKHQSRQTHDTTEMAFELNGRPISRAEVCHGIENGTLHWLPGTKDPPSCVGDLRVMSSSATIESSSLKPQTVASFSESQAMSLPSLTTSTQTQIRLKNVGTTCSSTPSVPGSSMIRTSPKDTAPGTTVTSQVSTSSILSSDSGAATNTGPQQNVDLLFPDQEVPCSTFPSQYGAIPVTWAGLGGWAGIQYITDVGGNITNIETALPGGRGCIPGAMCSYACPPGYQKSQWPETQGIAGQSIGGLACNNNGRLHLTNAALSDKLCIAGTGTVSVRNRLEASVAICRTDYPGTENEVVPLETLPGETQALTCPDSRTYFRHQGKPTTAQYYLNNQGISIEDACIWGVDGHNRGNWAPTVLGAGRDDNGLTWLSIFTTNGNHPLNYRNVNYTVEITGDISDKCRLKDGRYCSGSAYDVCSDQGCSVQLLSGEAVYVLSP